MFCFFTHTNYYQNITMWIDILLHHITSDSPTYDLITWVKMFFSDNQLGLVCVFVFKLTIQSIKYRGP